MSLTAMECAKIRLYLGLTDQFRYLDSRLESILSNDLSAEGETLVRVSLTALATIETQMFSTATMGAAGVKRVDEVTFFDGHGVSPVFTSLKALARPHIARISIILGVPIYGDVFGSTGWPGDSFSELGGFPSNTGRGGMIPLG